MKLAGNQQESDLEIQGDQMEASLAGRAPGLGTMKACSVLRLPGLTGRVRWGGAGGRWDPKELHTIQPTLRGVLPQSRLSQQVQWRGGVGAPGNPTLMGSVSLSIGWRWFHAREATSQRAQ